MTVDGASELPYWVELIRALAPGGALLVASVADRNIFTANMGMATLTFLAKSDLA